MTLPCDAASWSKRLHDAGLKMRWSLTMTNSYKKPLALFVTLVLACHLCGGTGLFCTKQFPHPARSSGNDRPGTPVFSVEQGNVSVGAWSPADKHRGPSECTCKKRKCPTIPRSAILSKPPHRFTTFHFQPKHVGFDSLLPQVKRVLFGLGGSTSLVQWVSLRCLPFTSPLACTSVLLM